MTNGEKIIAILKPRKDQIRIYDNWVEIEIQKLGINFSCELDWWNTECNEPTTKNDTTKNDLGVDCSLDDFIKYCKRTFGVELTVKKSDNPDTYTKLFGTTNNDLEVDCINRQAAITFVCKNIKEILKDTTPLEVKLSDDYIYENVAKIMRNPKVLPSVTPQEQEPTLDKIREEISKAWHTHPQSRYEEGLKDQALRDMKIIDKYRTESEVKE